VRISPEKATPDVMIFSRFSHEKIVRISRGFRLDLAFFTTFSHILISLRDVRREKTKTFSPFPRFAFDARRGRARNFFRGREAAITLRRTVSLM
jgi:hypothetical protein